MIERLSVRNFKAWRDLDIELPKVTGLFGTNSSGKSSILQFLLMLKQTKNATDRGLVLDFGSPDELVNLGSYLDIVHKQDASKTIDWSLEWIFPRPIEINDPIIRHDNIPIEFNRCETSCAVRLRHSKPWACHLFYSLGGERPPNDLAFGLEPSLNDSTNFRLTSSPGYDSQFIRTRGRMSALPGPIKTHLFPRHALTLYQNTDFLGHLEFEYESLMDRIFYLGPLRAHPKREYRWGGAAPLDVGSRGERTIAAILAATAEEGRQSLGSRENDKQFQEIIEHWLKRLGLGRMFCVRQIAQGANLYQASVKHGHASPELMLTDVGFGVSQLLPTLVLLYYVPEGSIVLIEQPEIHLHPSAQSGLADLILTVAKSRNVQIIVESHSEHLLRRLQRRVAEGEMPARDVQLYFTSIAENGAARLDDLALNKWGEIRNWPTNFFGNELEEIAAIKIAGLERKLGKKS